MGTWDKPIPYVRHFRYADDYASPCGVANSYGGFTTELAEVGCPGCLQALADGYPRHLDSFSADERAVIFQRRKGWEKADALTLAAAFCTTRETITAIVRAEQKNADDKAGLAPSSQAQGQQNEGAERE